VTNGESYSNIRDILGDLVGQRLVEVTQHDMDEWQETGEAYIMLMFENGASLQVFIGEDGFEYVKGVSD